MNERDLENINFKLTDDLWEDLTVLEGEPIDSLVVWDSSLVDENLDEPVTDENRIYVDFELYLSNQTLLELYGAAVVPDEGSDALVGLDVITERLSGMAAQGARIEGIFADQDDGLVLLLASPDDEVFVPVTAWIESVWENLPDE
ncbi:MAG: hypothetical protein J5I90_09215 [Caldilineales bacterium]|nr:hypothetical protein [Caldilineales bacterium]